MKTLEWRCVNGGGFVRRSIDFVSRGTVCHVEFLVDGQTLGARADGGVKYRPIDPFPVDFRFKAELPDEQWQKVMDFLSAQIGKPYDYSAIMGILLNHDWENEGSWYCSELWAAALQAGQVIGPFPKAVKNVTPQDALLISFAMGF